MRRPILAAFIAALVLLPVLVLRGQSTTDEPHGDLQLDCAECHNPERWVVARVEAEGDIELERDVVEIGKNTHEEDFPCRGDRSE